MPLRPELHKILILGSGPIVIGQGCEFDYSGVQACKALKSVGCKVVLVNSNPATIMTDPDMADHTYIEPITWQTVKEIIKLERPDAILSTMGGQTALNCALELEKHGVLEQYNVELIGANKQAIKKAEDRALFRQAMEKIGLNLARSAVAHDFKEALQIQQTVGFPCIIRPSYTLGGSGGGIAYKSQDFWEICEQGFALSLNHQLLIEESLLGWKEYELEVIRDANDSCIIVCTIENLDPMGVHTGDSITVAPAQTLTDYEYQQMRDAAIKILREIGVETGGSNVQFAVHPQTGRMVVIEMNPRVSRSSALASKATGFPIAKIAALLAVGYTLDELQNDITAGIIPASFEPSIDYVVVKIPRFNFDKFAGVKARLTTQMQSVGEVMAIGATFQQALQKALCSLETDLDGFEPQINLDSITAEATLLHELQYPSALRLLYVADALRYGFSIPIIHQYTGIDPWFLDQIQQILIAEQHIVADSIANLTAEKLLYWKQIGFSDARIAKLLDVPETLIRTFRTQVGLTAKFKRIDSCAAEFPATTAYLYATYEGDCEARPTNKSKVIVLGSGPTRIGQGIEFDYCCVQAVQALQQNNIEAIMINCNPETVSTDYDISDRLYFEALRLETVLEIVNLEQPLGVILQLGGQTPLKLAEQLHKNGVKILGTSFATIDLAEDRAQFSKVIHKLGLKQPENMIAHDVESGLVAAQKLGFPLMVRPSYVLGGRAMEIIANVADLTTYLTAALHVPILMDHFLQNATEVDVDIVADGQGGVFVAGIMEHVEHAGVHSGDSTSCLPPHTLSQNLQDKIKQQAEILAKELNVIGLLNIQFAIQNDVIYVLEANPRASRTVPFVSKSIGIAIAKLAVEVMLGKSLREQNLSLRGCAQLAVKQSVFPFNKFLGVDPLLGPEMRSTGEVMAFGNSFAHAHQKTMQAIGGSHAATAHIPGSIFLSLKSNELILATQLIKELAELKIDIYVDQHTAKLVIPIYASCKVIHDETRIMSLIASGDIDFIINNVDSGVAMGLAKAIRSSAIKYRVQYATTLAGARAMIAAIRYNGVSTVFKLQSIHEVRVLEYEL